MRAIPENVAQTTKDILRQNVRLGGTGEQAQTGGDAWGKTGTTDNNGDAWFCGGTDHFTACVWVGHAQTNTPMETEYGGEPVDGGTFPAIIWSQVMQACEAICDPARGRGEAEEDDDDGDSDSDAAAARPTSRRRAPAPRRSAPAAAAAAGGGWAARRPRARPGPRPGAVGGGAPSGTGGTGL